MYSLEQVRDDLLKICDEHPDTKGRSLWGRADETGCYYFVDPETGKPTEGQANATAEKLLQAAPCCIVGRWFAMHPETLSDEDVARQLAENQGCSEWYWPAEYGVVSFGAAALLGNVQAKQDEGDYNTAPTFRQLREFIVNYDIVEENA